MLSLTLHHPFFFNPWSRFLIWLCPPLITDPDFDPEPDLPDLPGIRSAVIDHFHPPVTWTDATLRIVCWRSHKRARPSSSRQIERGCCTVSSKKCSGGERVIVAKSLPFKGHHSFRCWIACMNRPAAAAAFHLLESLPHESVLLPLFTVPYGTHCCWCSCY